MSRSTSCLFRGLAAAFVLLGSAQTLACAGVTTVTPELPLQVQARPPAAALADLSPVPQPPLPPRVTLEGEVLVLDETPTFDDANQLAGGHEDILAEVAAWLDQHGEVAALTVEIYSIGEGNKRAHKKRSAAMAEALVAALTAQGVDPKRLVAVGAGQSEHEHPHVVFRVTAEGAKP